MWKKMVCILVTAIAVMLGGCLGSQEPISATLHTLPTTIPSTEDTVLPTTMPTEATTTPTAQAAGVDNPVKTDADITIKDTMPEYDSGISEVTVSHGEENSYFLTTYVQLPTAAGGETLPYNQGAFWFCTDQEVMLRGNHYDTYYLEGDTLQKLPNISISQEYTILDETVKLELTYSVYNGQALITHTPVKQDEHYAWVIDSSRGPKECLVRFEIDNGKEYYYALVDLETGIMTDFLAGFNRAAIQSLAIFRVLWLDDNSFIALDVSPERGHVYIDVPGQQIVPNYQLPFDIPDTTLINHYGFSPETGLRVLSKRGTYRIYDPVDNHTVALELPKLWTGNWIPMNGGRQLLMLRKYNTVYQILLFDGDADTLIRIERENSNAQEAYHFVSDSELVIYNFDNHKEFCIYRFNKK